MNRMRMMAVAVLVAAGGLVLQGARAQQPGIGRVELQQRDLSVPGREGVQARVDFAPGAVAAWHAHPGEELAYVLEGTLEYRVGDQPPVTLKAGEALFIPAGAPHTAKNVGAGDAKELATYFVEKGKPLAVPAAP